MIHNKIHFPSAKMMFFRQKAVSLRRLKKRHMKKLLVLVAVAIGLSSCGLLPTHRTIICNGPVQEMPMEKIKNFTDVTIDGEADVYLGQADKYSVVVRANQEVFDYLDYRLSGRTFTIAPERYVTLSPEVYQVYVQAPWYSKFVVNGAAYLSMTEGYVSQSDLDVVINGTADMDFIGVAVPVLNIEVYGTAKINLTDVFVDKLYIKLMGSGSVVISGSADLASFTITGKGLIDALHLECQNIEQHVSGSGTIKL